MLFYLFLIIILHININIWIYCFVSGLKCKCQSSTTDKIPHSEPLLPDHHLKVCIVHLLHVWVVVGEICHACCHISRSVHPFFFFGLCNVVLVHSADSSESERAPSPLRRSDSPSRNSDHRFRTSPMIYIYLIHT